ncbi:styrene monooxygenase/indole monooxygenase family protein, partial [Streptomyces sp. URMC 129]|uniref:styrene monooxygenase/indole monooxygenase family protein n=1 Tax=Streptomyces sp. URMC 129 TaxID=3423407 RepID=UPI003F1C7681
MRRITIVGAGQAGLQLANGLAAHGYQVTVVSDRTPEQIRDGRVMSSQCMFGRALAHEADLGLDLWGDRCPRVEAMAVSVADGSGGRAVAFSSRMDAPARSVDQRVKIPAWLAELERRGGTVEVRRAGVADLEAYARASDLVIVAAGKGEIAGIFARDAARSPFGTPRRALAVTYVTGMAPPPGDRSAVTFNIVPGVGEYFTLPALTTTGPCDIMIFEGLPGGPMDRWHEATTPDEHLALSQELLRLHVPWEAERCADLTLTDPAGVLAGRFAPTVRTPVAHLPSGAAVLGMADTVVLNDPIAGQGSNTASKAAASYLASILDHGDRPYDETFMRQTFDRFWDYAQYVTAWSNALLDPPPPHI